MKKIINKMVFDTKTAEFIANYSYSNSRDFNHISEDLYRTKNGRWFIVGEGGPNSKYVVQTGCNEWSGSKQLLDISPEEALEWLEEHGETEAIEKYFSDCLKEA